jgi:hypothetical protein
LIKDYFNSVGPFAHKMIDVNIPSTPLPSEEKFYDKQLPFDPICGGAGGDGTQYQVIKSFLVEYEFFFSRMLSAEISRAKSSLLLFSPTSATMYLSERYRVSSISPT